MSIKKISQTQPESFEFSKENILEAENEIKKYPKDRKASAILALLYLAQKDLNCFACGGKIRCIPPCIQALKF